MKKLAMSYENLAHGALAEQVDIEIGKILANVEDPNVPWKPKRELTIKVSFNPNEDRGRCAISIAVSTKMPGLKGIDSDCFITRVRDKLVAFERDDPRQQGLFDEAPPAETKKPDLTVVRGGASATN